MATCSASALLASGSCFQCLTKKELQIVIAQLLCEIQAGGGGSSGPKVYRALISQSGTDAPVATVLENTLGGEVTFTRQAAGDYFAEGVGLFPYPKTVASLQSNYVSGNTYLADIDVQNFNPDKVRFWTGVVDSNGAYVNVDIALNPAAVYIEILVYP